MKSRILYRMAGFIFISLFLFAFLFFPSLARDERTPVIYKIKLEMVRNDIATHIKVGDEVIDAVGKYSLGKIQDVRQELCYTELYSHEKKECVLSSYDGYCNITLSFFENAYSNGLCYSVNGYPLRLYKEVSLRTPDFCGTGKIVLISPQESSK